MRCCKRRSQKRVSCQRGQSKALESPLAASDRPETWAVPLESKNWTLTMLREKPVKIIARIVRLVATPCFSISVARDIGWQPDGPGASRDRPRIAEQCGNVGAGVRPRFCAISELVLAPRSIAFRAGSVHGRRSGAASGKPRLKRRGAIRRLADAGDGRCMQCSRSWPQRR